MKASGVLRLLKDIELYLLFIVFFFAGMWMLIRGNDRLYDYFTMIHYLIYLVSIMYLVLTVSSVFLTFMEIFSRKRFDVLHILFCLATTAVILAIGLYFSTIRTLYQ